MKRIVCYYLFLMIFQSFGQVKIFGTVENVSTEKVSIKEMSLFPIKEVKLTDGKFVLELPLTQGYYFLSIGDESATIYVTPEDDLNVSVDYNEFEKTLQFKGKGAEPNNYLHRNSIIRDNEKKDLKVFYTSSPEKFKENLITLRDKLIKELDNYSVSESFKKDELENIAYEYLFSLYNFAQYQDSYFEKEVEQPKEFIEEFDAFDFDNEAVYSRIPYYRYLAQQKWENEIASRDSYYGKKAKFHQIGTKELRFMVFLDFLSKISEGGEEAEDYFRLIKDISTNEKLIEFAKAEFEKIKKVKNGSESPLFNYEDINGKKVSLSDFKGKYVYIDVWATWCKPCIAQIPDLKKLEHDYKDQDVVFVSISVDKESAKERWKKMVKKKGLKGVQLLADNSFESDFIDALGVSSIPSFILIGPDGKIIEKRSSKPSSEKIRNTFNELLRNK